MEQVAQRLVYIVLARYLSEMDKQWKIIKVCKSREEADKVLEAESHVNAVLERLAEYRTQILRG